MLIHAGAPISAKVFTQLPVAYRHTGAPSTWAKMTRPGKALHSFLEGLVFDSTGDLWLADVAYGRIFRIDPTRTWHLMYAGDGEPHSLRPIANGRFAVVDYSRGLLIFTPATGMVEALCGDDRGQPFLGLSDLTVASNGDIWFTDSGRTSLSDPRGHLYCRQADGTLIRVLDMIPYPNGVVLSPAEDLVFVAVTRANAVWRLKAKGAETPPMVGVHIHLSGGLGPDGLAITPDGFLAVAHAQAGRAFIFDPLGNPVSEVRTPDGISTTSVAFDRDDNLYIAEADSATIYVTPRKEWGG